ncbi:DUF4097 family beta strand repeat-containing protein [Micromonospora sp. NPDC005367]|uniref:DUF4097 family beta strand repeat-containing protein n=1 Tax=Micromonospora sp. NPDC005367 TaxID=3155590 RepID=UPI00339F67B4
MPTFATPAPVAAVVEVAGAQVRVVASDRTDTVVLIEPIDAASRKDIKVAERTTVDLSDGKLSVKTTVSGDRAGSVAITIDLPTGSGLAAYLAHSDVHADGALGACDLHMASGRARLDHVEAWQANIASGEVEIGHVAGRAEVDGGAFTLRIGDVEGTMRLSNSGGRVWIGHAHADLDLSSASCDFDVDHAHGSVTAGTASGAIRIGRMTSGTAKLTNGSGDIEVGIAEGVSAHLDVKSERGAVRDSVSAQGNPDPADTEVSVHARTRHGDVVIRRTAR